MSNDPKGKHLEQSIANLASREGIESSKWLTSKEAMQKLGISGCDLMHKRMSGELVFKKKGNSYLYLLDTPSD
ncbi:hypothetical protein [Shewanella sp.]|uniref:hypothetical protein n=1 Tax=Shewanella sp. TaxID=50422 RepID=UPI001EB1F166|nr:hypothetical protein [Shewanella sp.]NRB24581.1 hypothetical protein [Shewanella sp.]